MASHLRSHLMMNLAPVRDLRLRPGDSLPHPRILAERSRQCDCGFKGDILFAFRLGLGGGLLIPDRPVSAPVLHGLARHLPLGIDRIALNSSMEPKSDERDGFGDLLRQNAAIALD